MEKEEPQESEINAGADNAPPDGKPHRKWYQRKNTFQKGNTAWKGGRGKAKGPKTPRVLLDMRYVYAHPSGPFKSEAQRKLKEEWDSFPKDFFQRLISLEKSHAAKTEKVSDPLSAGGKDAPSYDEGTQRCLELIERLLKTRGWEKNSSQQSLTSEVNDNC